jgi:single-stranded DNA-binding protein
LGERVLKTITKGREVVVQGRLAISEYTTERDGVKIEVKKPVIELTSFHLCGKKPTSNEETLAPESKPDAPKTKKLAAVKG